VDVPGDPLSHHGARPLEGVLAVPLEALLPVILLAVAFVGYCLYDLSRSEVDHLPKWAWALLILFVNPLGGIAYLVVGRAHR
jgi:hypothetical protein